MKKVRFFITAFIFALIIVLIVLLSLVIAGYRIHSVYAENIGRIYLVGRGGYGTVYYPNGTTAEYTAEGKLIMSDGSVYTGDIEKYLPNGNGTMLYANQESYEGSFVNGKPDGEGVFIYGKGAEYTGTFRDSAPYGDFVMSINYDNGSDSLTGSVSVSGIYGNAEYIFRNGTYYIGGFRNGLFSGHGKMAFANGDVYEGGFSDGNMSGEGTYTFSDGSVYTGEFEDSLPNGIGTYTYEKDGVTMEITAFFRDGQVVNLSSES